MVGQVKNIEMISSWRIRRKTPRFIIIEGEGERLELAKAVAKSLNSNIVLVEEGVEGVRRLVDCAYTTTETTTYVFENGDKMTAKIGNALLKIVEEPPNNAYFIILCEESDNMLLTIRNRSIRMRMEPYLAKDLKEIANNNELLTRYCRTPQQVYTWVDQPKKFEEFIEYCKEISKNIDKMTGVQAFRLIEKLKLKEEENGYDPVLFIYTVTDFLLERISRDSTLNTAEAKMVSIACVDAVLALKRAGIKKDSTIDTWILDIRRALEK